MGSISVVELKWNLGILHGALTTWLATKCGNWMTNANNSDKVTSILGFSVCFVLWYSWGQQIAKYLKVEIRDCPRSIGVYSTLSSRKVLKNLRY